MRTLTDSVEVDAPPDQVWKWLQTLSDHYLAWHHDHISAEWIRGDPNDVGSVMEVVENVGGHRERLRFEVTQISPPRLMEYRMRGLHSLLLPKGAFQISPRNGHSEFTASISYRGGRVVEGLFRRRVAALREHMRQEGQNLQRLFSSRS